MKELSKFKLLYSPNESEIFEGSERGRQDLFHGT